MAPQDSFIDDEEETCPLCIEEFDLSDRNFKPCPCSYQICQFCFNNIRSNANGLCPACRRPYDDKTIEWKAVSQEELAQHRAQAAKQAKKKADIRQKELQKREVETANRKHLQGLRVVQKNLVYVLGLNPSIQEDQLLQTLRGDKYFGQYGKIIKIVVSKAKHNDNTSSTAPLGVYVTFAREEDAARCIAAVNGSQNGDRVLRAQLGTTKYCSAYLRNETCNNKQCMFLHEPGDNDDSYSRQDLSSINVANTQRPLPPLGSSARQAALVQAPVAHVQPVSAAVQPMDRENSNQGSDGGDNSALPSSVNWATKGAAQRSRRGSQATSGAAPSPAVSHSIPVVSETVEEPAEDTTSVESQAPSSESALVEETPKPYKDPVLVQLLKDINSAKIFFVPSVAGADASYPPLFDENGGMKRRVLREQQDAHLVAEPEADLDVGSVAAPSVEEEFSYASGSLQLGGEPDNADSRDQSQGFQGQTGSQLPIQRGGIGGITFSGQPGQAFSQGQQQLDSPNGQALTSSQRQIQHGIKATGQQQSDFSPQFPPGIGGHPSQGSLIPHHGHQRGTSRFSFNENTPSSIKSSANSKVMAQQSSMMPSAIHSSLGGQFFGPSQGPPPGLKSTGTPPMFGPGQSFGAGGSFGGAGKDNQRELEILRQSRGGSQTLDANKQDFVDDEYSKSMKHDVDTLLEGSLDDDTTPHGQTSYSFGSGSGSRPTTPSVPPGFEHTHGHPSPALREDNTSKMPTKMIPTSAEFTPRPRAATPLSQVSLPTSPVQAKTIHTTSTAQARLDTKALATSSGLSKEIAAQASKSALQATEFPALDSPRHKSKAAGITSTSSVTAASAPVGSAKKTASVPTSSTQLPAKQAEKKSTPGILNVSAPAKTPKISPAVETPSQGVVDPSDFPALKPALPSQPTAPRSTPKTLVIKTVPSKATEIASTPIGTLLSSVSAVPLQITTTRPPSIATLVKSDVPGTPTSEVISDNVSLTSTSMSRANSPPPTRIGSAPQRENTKSKQKKERVQRAREKAEQEAAAAATTSIAKTEPEVVDVAPVLGRKKRQKKDRVVSSTRAGTARSTPSASRAPSPGLGVKVDIGKSEAVTEKTDVPTKLAMEPGVNKQSTQAVEEVKQKQIKTKSTPVFVQEVTNILEPVVEQEPSEKPIPLVSTIAQKLHAEGDIDALENLGLLKAPSFSIKLADSPIDIQSANQKLTITPEDRNTLLAGHPVHKIAEGPNRIMLTPNGDCVRNLTEAEEQQYLELQARIAESIGPTAFISPKYSSGNGFTLIGGRAVPNGLPSFFPSAITGAPAMDPVSKIQRDEALSYINQYVLPSLSSNSQLEKALNANALDKSLLNAPLDASNWAQWGHDMLPPSSSSHPETAIPSGTPNPESMLGLESITAHFAVASGLSNSVANGSVLNGGTGSTSVGMLSVSEAESALQLARKEAEGFEKRLNALIKKNRKLLLGSGH